MKRILLLLSLAFTAISYQAQVFNGFKGGVVNVVESAAAVFSLATVQSEFGLFVSEQSGEKLVNVHTAKL